MWHDLRMKRYCFTDSSGILKSDRFFGTGLLVVKNVGDLSDKLYKNSQQPKAIVKVQKNTQIDQLIALGRTEEVIKMLKGNYRFEMKFDTISKVTLPYYERMIDIFLSDDENRFSAMIVDKQSPEFDVSTMGDAWETYTKYIAILVAREMKSLPSDDELCLIVDEISKPQDKPLSLEDTIMSKVREELTKDPALDFNKVFGALTIESHSNLAMQLCDLLLGAVMYDYKKKSGMHSEKTIQKKEVFVQKLRSSLGIETLADEFVTTTKPYFTVFDCVV